MKRFYRSKLNGMVFEDREIFKTNPDLELVTEMDVSPEAFAPEYVKRPSGLSLGTQDEALLAALDEGPDRRVVRREVRVRREVKPVTEE